jgi:hypothetical protein
MAKTFLVFVIAATTLFLPVGASTQAPSSSGTRPSAKDVLTASDRARNPDQDCVRTVRPREGSVHRRASAPAWAL